MLRGDGRREEAVEGEVGEDFLRACRRLGITTQWMGLCQRAACKWRETVMGVLDLVCSQLGVR